MSQVVIRKLLETRVNTVGGVFPTAFENTPFTPVVGTPWQAVALIPGQTQDPGQDSSVKREVGVLQVMLKYPKNAGAAAATQRAETLRAGFPRGLSLQEGNVLLRIFSSPYIGTAVPDGAWLSVPLTVPYTADVTS